MRFLLAALLFFSSFVRLSAQEGLPFVTELELPREYNDLRITASVQNAEETMFFATSRGILSFDGAKWERITTPSPVASLHYNKPSGRILIGMRSGATELVKTDSGTYTIVPIQGISTTQSVSRILSNDNTIFLIAESELFVMPCMGNTSAARSSYEGKLISGGLVHDNSLYLLFYQEGLFKWNEDRLESVGDYSALAENQVLFSFSVSGATYVGFDSDRIYRFSKGRFEMLSSEIQQFASENILSDGILLNDSLMAFASLAGGAIIANVSNQRVRLRFDYTTGIKDNEIFCLGKDNDQGMWMAYEGGLSRVDLIQPVKSFSAYPGLDGYLTASLMVNGTFYVATGNGVFVLKQASNKAEMQHLMEEMMRKKEDEKKEEATNYVPPQTTSSPTSTKNTTADLIERYEQNPDDVKEELSKKELRDLKKEIRQQRRDQRKNKSAKEVVDEIYDSNEAEIATTEPESQSGPDPMKGLIPDPKTGPVGSGMTAPPGSGATNRSKPQVLTQSAGPTKAEQKVNASARSYLYRKIKGMEVKCRQLVNLGSEIFAATNNGLFILSNETATNLTPGLYINHVWVQEKSGKLLLATMSGVHVLSRTNGKWTVSALDKDVSFAAYNVISTTDGEVWAGTDNGSYRFSKDKSWYYRIPNVQNERVLVSEVYGSVHFLLPNSIFHYMASSDTILAAELPELPTGHRLEYMLGNNGTVWIRSNLGWHVLNGEQHIPLLPYLDLFEDVRQLTSDDKGNLYIIDGTRHVYSVQNHEKQQSTDFTVYIRQALDVDGKPFALESMSIETNNNYLILNVSAPFYLKSEGTQYQYRIEGLRDSWSRWSTDPVIEIDYVPAGEYVLQVRAKNVLGDVSDVKSLSFTVPKPIWLRWYAILVYIAILSSGFFTVIKIRERSLKETQKILEEKVAQRTADLEDEKKKTEELLLNILPRETADELQKYGKATARHYNQVSVLFTDFKGFTNFAENTRPEDLVSELHSYFVRFDEIIGKYYLEKIKTIGDAYMCAGGVPIRNNSNAIAITLAALEIRDFMDEVCKNKRQRNEVPLEIRIGIHTGPLTAGVVGMKKFAYDIWGDTVNTASRMETASEPGMINVSGTTHELIKKYFECESRGKKEVKGKGPVDMYFVNRIKPEFTVNGDGRTPNQQLMELVG